MPGMPRALCALVLHGPHVSRALRSLVSLVLQALCDFKHHVIRALRTLVSCVLCSLRALASHVPCAHEPYALRAVVRM